VTRPRALVLAGGWEVHQPEALAEFAAATVLDGFDVIRTGDLDALDPATLAGFDLLVPLWTFGAISPAQEAALVEAVGGGLGLVTWHGATSAFLASRPFKFLVGGQFVAHPGDEDVTYTVEFVGDDPLVAGLAPVTVTSEQYYLLVDPAVTVLATTRMVAPGMDWLAGVEMPAAWCRTWGGGRVFYCSLGHTVEILELASVTTLLRRAAVWATRPSDTPPAR
jgi:type 1 glutamine amidotransferase